MQLTHVQEQINHAISFIDTNVKMVLKRKKKLHVAGLIKNVSSQDETVENCFANFGNLSVLMIVIHTVNPEENTKTC